ncbi:MAG: hypothetical protein K2W95_15860 [Candidatus Obscuribacterales bacterium]|nr:hypothetical protein [Candidatus Obscuribacterales bacterium]
MTAAAQYVDVERYARALGKAQGHGDSWKCLCPSHKDESPSLKLSWEGRLLWWCHAGCDSLTVRDDLLRLFPELREILQPGVRSPNDYYLRQLILERYDYHNLDETLQFQKLRIIPRDSSRKKDFATRKPDGRGGWQVKDVMKDIDPVLYRLPRFRAAIEKDQPIFFVEGEKDADRLWSLGLAATTTFTSSGVWKPHYTEWLLDARVFIIPDNDDPGFKHAAKVGEALTKANIPVNIVELFGLAHKQDISDWLDQGYTKEQLQVLVDEAVKYSKNCYLFTNDFPQEKKEEVAKANDNVVPIKPDVNLPPWTPAFTEFENGRRLIKLCGDDIRFLPGNPGKWFRWDDKRFAPVCDQAIERLGFKVADVVANEEHYDPEKKNKWISRCLSVAGCRATLSAAKTQEEILRPDFGGDNHPLLINCPNGVLDLDKYELLPHDRKYEFTQIAHTPVDLDNPAPELWCEFLDTVMGADGEMISFLQRLCGYLLTGLVTEQVFFLLFGPGGNGKSAFVDVITHILKDYAVNTRTEMWLQTTTKDQEDNPARLYGKRVAAGAEIDNDARLNEHLIKKVTGEREITGRLLYHEGIEFASTCKLILHANTLPTIKGTDEGIWRRVVPIPFDVIIPEEKRDKKLLSKLEVEHPQILAWMAWGYQLYKEVGLNLPEKVRLLRKDYRETQDFYKQFLDETTSVHIMENVEAGKLYVAYIIWCKDSGLRPVTIQKFGREISRKVQRERESACRNYLGITLKPEWEKRVKAWTKKDKEEEAS